MGKDSEVMTRHKRSIFFPEQLVIQILYPFCSNLIVLPGTVSTSKEQ